jgi:hypothetical protein
LAADAVLATLGLGFAMLASFFLEIAGEGEGIALMAGDAAGWAGEDCDLGI